MVEAAQIAGNVVQGVAGYEAGRFNRGVARAQAIEAERDGTVDEARIREAARLAIGEQAAAQAGNGFQPGTGSALEALQQSQTNAALDALTARRSAAAKSRGLRVQGDIAYAAGQNALVTGMLGAASAGVDWASPKKNLS